MKKIIFALAAVCLLPVVSTGAGNDKIEEIYRGIDFSAVFDSIPENVKNDLDVFTLDDVINFDIKDISLDKIIKRTGRYFIEGILSFRNMVFSVFAFIVLEIFISVISLDAEIKKAVNFALLFILFLIMSENTIGVMQESFSVINYGIKFMYTFVPLFCSLILTGGGAAASGIYGGIMLFTCEILGNILERLFFPLCISFLLISLGASFSSSNILLKISEAFGKIVKALITFSSVLFVFVLSFSNRISSASDSIALKTAGMITGAFVPVIGGVLKDALSSFKGYIYIISAATGLFCMASGIILFLPSLINLFIYKIILTVFEEVHNNSDFSFIGHMICSFKDTVNIIIAFQCFTLFIIVASLGIVMLYSYGG